MGDDGRVLEVPAAFLVSYLSNRISDRRPRSDKTSG
jgi:hypothetical protein